MVDDPKKRRRATKALDAHEDLARALRRAGALRYDGAILRRVEYLLAATPDEQLARVTPQDLEAVARAEVRSGVARGAFAAHVFARYGEGAQAALLDLARFASAVPRLVARRTMELFTRMWPPDFGQRLERLHAERADSPDAVFAAPARLAADALEGLDPNGVVALVIRAIDRGWGRALAGLPDLAPSAVVLVAVVHVELESIIGEDGARWFDVLLGKLAKDPDGLVKVLQAIIDLDAWQGALFVGGISPRGRRIARRLVEGPIDMAKGRLTTFSRLVVDLAPLIRSFDMVETLAEATVLGLSPLHVKRVLEGWISGLRALFPALPSDANERVRPLVLDDNLYPDPRRLARLIHILASAPSEAASLLELVAYEHLELDDVPWRRLLACPHAEREARMRCLGDVAGRSSRAQLGGLMALFDALDHAPVAWRVVEREPGRLNALADLVTLTPPSVLDAWSPPAIVAGEAPPWAPGLPMTLVRVLRRMPRHAHERARILIVTAVRGPERYAYLHEAVAGLADRATLDDWQRDLETAIGERARAELGPAATDVRLDARTLAALLGVGSQERALARRLIAHVAASGSLPPRTFPESVGVLAGLARAGLRIHAWLGTDLPAPAPGVRARLASDLRTLLAIGAAFGTCLAPGRPFFPATLTVAASANLRALVIEQNGKMIARAVIALTVDGMRVYRFYAHHLPVATPYLERALIDLGRAVGCAVGTLHPASSPLTVPTVYADRLELPMTAARLRADARFGELTTTATHAVLLDHIEAIARYGLLSADLPAALIELGIVHARPGILDALAARLTALGQVGVAARLAPFAARDRTA